MRYGSIGVVTAMVLAAAMTAGGCGGGSGGSAGAGGTGGADASTGTAVTSLSGARALNALTTAEANQLCNDTYGYFASAIPQGTECKWKGLSYAASSSAPSQTVLQQNCTTQENACLQADGGASSNPGCGDIPPDCTATVAQYSTCISDEVSAFSQTVGGLPSCATLTSAGTGAIFDAQTGGTPPASCASLSNACPALYPPSPISN